MTKWTVYLKKVIKLIIEWIHFDQFLIIKLVYGKFIYHI